MQYYSLSGSLHVWRGAQVLEHGEILLTICGHLAVTVCGHLAVTIRMYCISQGVRGYNHFAATEP